MSVFVPFIFVFLFVCVCVVQGMHSKPSRFWDADINIYDW